MRLMIELPVIFAMLGQAPAPPPAASDPEFAAQAPARLEYMKESIRAYTIRTAADPEHPLVLQSEPALRFTNPVGRSRDGTVFLWLDSSGRPGAVAQASILSTGPWYYEFISLSPGPLSATDAQGPFWNPATGGVEFQPMPGAPRPADTPERRLVQMRALTREFTVDDMFERKNSWHALRQLPKPFARYGKAGSGILDGALFSYVLTTDPEAYLMLEAREGKSGLAWYYAWAPSTMYPLRASHKGKVVWEKNLEGGVAGPNLPLRQLISNARPDLSRGKTP